jgi:DNA-binding NarL/FixJ family response regulator
MNNVRTDTQSRRYKDPAELTEYEQALLDLKRDGLTHKQIAQTCKASENTISNKFTIINHKLKLAATGEW